MFQILYNLDSYHYNIISAQISITLLIFAYIATSIIAILFGLFLWRRTKKLSSFYLFLISLCYGIFSLFDFITWTGTPNAVIFSWSIVDIFWMSFSVLSYWFLYSFIKNKDLPVWQKIVSVGMLIPTFIITTQNLQMDTVYIPTYNALEKNEAIPYYYYVVGLFLILINILFTFIEYSKTADAVEKKKIALAGLGTFLFLFMVNFWGFFAILAGHFNLFGYAENDYFYNLEIYGNFGLPILLAFLGYLIMKYQAFDLKPIKSVMLVIMLMLILFVSVFI